MSLAPLPAAERRLRILKLLRGRSLDEALDIAEVCDLLEFDRVSD